MLVSLHDHKHDQLSSLSRALRITFDPDRFKIGRNFERKSPKKVSRNSATYAYRPQPDTIPGRSDRTTGSRIMTRHRIV